jgi:rRNA maturation RNase YbeY
MGNISIPIFVESRYKVNKKRIRNTVSNILEKQGMSGPLEVSIAIIGDRKMRSLSKKYRNEDKTRNVLSFSLAEGEAGYLPKDTLRLGDIVVSYPQVIKEASEEEMLVDDKVDELVEHGLRHLLGINHK